MSDRINFYGMQDWLAEVLRCKGIYYLSQVTSRSEDELINSGWTLGTVRNLSIYLEKNGLYMVNGENSLMRLHLHSPGLRLLMDQGIDCLDDLEDISVSELANDYGLGWDRAEFINCMMNLNGRRMRKD